MSQTFTVGLMRINKIDISTIKELLWAAFNQLYNYVILTLKKI